MGRMGERGHARGEPRSRQSRVRSRWRAWLIQSLPGLACRLSGMSRGELGALGEELAARWLRARGYRLLGRRLRTPHGEVDILCALGGRLIVVEVKATRGPRTGRDSWRPAEHLGQRQARRVARAASWLNQRDAGALAGGARVDLIEVWISAERGGCELVHHPDHLESRED